MAETAQTVSRAPEAKAVAAGTRPPHPKGPSKFEKLNKLYALPAPLRTFPLPTFVPHNPLSLFHILYVWLSQTIKPQSSHFDPLYQGWFSPETRTIHVTDARAIRGLWEQGFYGKGTLSRSEPAWLDREATRRGAKKKVTSEMITRQRRAERQKTKWERARKEQEVIEETLREEAAIISQETSEPDIITEPVAPKELVDIPVVGEPEIIEVPILSRQTITAPTGPLQILALPNSSLELESVNSSLVDISDGSLIISRIEDFDKDVTELYPPVGPLQLLALPNSVESYLISESSTTDVKESTPELLTDVDDEKNIAGEPIPNGSSSIVGNGHIKVEDVEVIGGSETNDDTIDESLHSDATTETNPAIPDGTAMPNEPPSTPPRRRKSVRFSPTVERTTFIRNEPPSPERAVVGSAPVEEQAGVIETPTPIKNQEHLQITLEEAFFLSYALGAFQVLDPTTKLPISNQELFYLCRQCSYFPPQESPSLAPDDPFMVNYIVYHHYRSLGWTPRSGIKFSVDWMLYVRGPVFTHAEFGVLILPSYSDEYWSSTAELREYKKKMEGRTWHWLSCINRVIVQAKKCLVLAYVDIPCPITREEEGKLGIDGVLGRYRVKEVMVKRFSVNRLRD